VTHAEVVGNNLCRRIFITLIIEEQHMEQPARTNKQLIQTLEMMGDKLRIHSIVATSEAGSGHPTSCMSAADLTAGVFFYAMQYDVANPKSPINDRFVLSKGHAAPLLYAAWAEAGAFPAERLKTLREFTSDLEGHPTPRLPWVEVATGSLGQGLSCGVGMAINSKYLDHISNNIFVLMGDGEAAEGSVWEAAEIASYYKLDNLIGIVDVNGLGQSQRTMYGHDTEVYRRRFEAFGWHAVAVDGHNVAEIVAALDEAMAVTDKPAVIVAATRKGKGVSFTEDKDGWHGKALKKGEELERAMAELEPKVAGFSGMKIKIPEGRSAGSGPAATVELAPSEYTIGQQVATREAYGEALSRLGDVNPLIVVLDGDTKNSTYSEKFMKAHPGRFFESFIAEQNMVGAAVGLSAMGKVPFASTFACFLTRSYDHIRMAAVSQSNLKLCGSHAGVSIGEDGPSQMALEDLAMMRAQPNMTVLYPCDAMSTERLLELMAYYPGPSYMRTSRPKTPVIYGPDEQFAIGGLKILRESANDTATVIGAGVTVFEALKAHDQLKKAGTSIRVIDLYSLQPIDSDSLRRCARETKRLITVEDHYAAGGLGDAVAAAVAAGGFTVERLCVREIPRSGTPEELIDHYGISCRHIVAAVTA
jgi:transketolase